MNILMWLCILVLVCVVLDLSCKIKNLKDSLDLKVSTDVRLRRELNIRLQTLESSVSFVKAQISATKEFLEAKKDVSNKAPLPVVKPEVKKATAGIEIVKVGKK